MIVSVYVTSGEKAYNSSLKEDGPAHSVRWVFRNGTRIVFWFWFNSLDVLGLIRNPVSCPTLHKKETQKCIGFFAINVRLVIVIKD